MKNKRKVFQKFFRNVPWQPVHADIKDSNLQIQLVNFDEMIADDNSEQQETCFPKYLKEMRQRKNEAHAML